MSTIRRVPWFAAALPIVLALAAPAVAAPTLEEALVANAPAVVKRLQAMGCRNVGVLKFLVTKDGDKLSDNVGPLNMTLANRLEIALLLANDPKKPLGVIERASAVAQRTTGANHLTRDGRLKLFAARYPLAWGKELVDADAFVTRTALVSKDLRTLTISLLAFTKEDNKLVALGDDFKTANRPSALSEMGESFVLRGAFDDGALDTNPATLKAREEKVIQVAAKVKEQEVKYPLQEKAPPVTLTAFYDGKPAAIEYRDGKAYLPEPREGQKVAFGLKRDDSKERYGIVLKVNGENTLYRQKLPDIQCRRWIMDPGERPYQIKGFQKDNKTIEEFRVLSAMESGERAINYGADVGTIILTVYREYKGKVKPRDNTDEGAALAAVTRGDWPEEKSKNYNALKARLLEDANRGLIVEGATANSAVKSVAFEPDPVPVMSVTIIYYRP
ncbi:MAG TPA: hypothetical protein DDY78_20465 [Planctomycetales bacterium]|jgi:hypothetical protein|nr:hypothetical protein [Planctomycetales bacterium]